ncbi:serum amyloid P-component-like [Heterodontus francisci]|uniref:serum amyloid P-component-like n=1 Tax=Heterodontus francisci TaxID=7792 RepID=UPI00355C5499
MNIFLLISIACLVTPLVIGDKREGLIGESLLFLLNTRSEHAVLVQKKEMSLNDLTLCLRFNTELRTKHTLFSFKSSTPSDLLLRREDESTMTVSFSGKEVRFQLPANLWGWVHICTTREANKGLVNLYVNGQPTARKTVRGSAPIVIRGNVILGHEEDSIGKDPNYVGELIDVNLWDRVLAPRTINLLATGESNTQGNVIDWLTTSIETKGSVVVQRSTKIQ